MTIDMTRHRPTGAHLAEPLTGGDDGARATTPCLSRSRQIRARAPSDGIRMATAPPIVTAARTATATATPIATAKAEAAVKITADTITIPLVNETGARPMKQVALIDAAMTTPPTELAAALLTIAIPTADEPRMRTGALGGADRNRLSRTACSPASWWPTLWPRTRRSRTRSSGRARGAEIAECSWPEVSGIHDPGRKGDVLLQDVDLCRELP